MKRIIANDTRKMEGVLVGSWEYTANNLEIQATFSSTKPHKSETSVIEWSLEKNGKRLGWKVYYCDTLHISKYPTYPISNLPNRCEFLSSEFPKLILYNT